MGGVCQIWAPIHYGTVMKYVANNFKMVFLGVCQFYQYGRDISPYLTNPNDKPLPNILGRGTPYNFKNNEIEPCDWPKRGHMVNFKASHWSRALLVFFPYPYRSRGVCHIWLGFVKSGILPIYDKS